MVLKWETEQMFTNSCEPTRQMLLTSLWGRVPTPACPPAFLWCHLGSDS